MTWGKTITFRVHKFCLFCTPLTNHLYYYNMYNRLSCLTSKDFQLKITSHIYFGTQKNTARIFLYQKNKQTNKKQALILTSCKILTLKDAIPNGTYDEKALTKTRNQTFTKFTLTSRGIHQCLFSISVLFSQHSSLSFSVVALFSSLWAHFRKSTIHQIQS